MNKIWFDRALIVAVLVMQIALFLRLGRLLPVSTEGRSGLGLQSATPSSVPSEAPPSVERLAGRHPQDIAEDLERLMAGAVEQAARMQSAIHFNRGWERLPATPSLDMRDTAAGYLVTFNIPDVDREHLDVILDGRVLTVHASCGGIGSGGIVRRYERRVLLPGSVDTAGNARAELTNDVLRVLVPRGVSDDGQTVVMRLF